MNTVNNAPRRGATGGRKVVVAFSGGLDTSYTVMYLAKELGYEVYAACANTGGFSAEQLRTNDENAYKLARIAQREGAAAVAVHGRTGSQQYSGKADWDAIRQVKQAVDIPVIANGDVFEPHDAVRILKVTGADLIFIGRGAMGDPWIFSRCAAALEGREPGAMPPPGERAETALRQFERALKIKGEKITCLEARKHFAWYCRGVPYAGYVKAEISKIASMDDIYRIADLIKRELG